MSEDLVFMCPEGPVPTVTLYGYFETLLWILRSLNKTTQLSEETVNLMFTEGLTGSFLTHYYSKGPFSFGVFSSRNFFMF